MAQETGSTPSNGGCLAPITGHGGAVPPAPTSVQEQAAEIIESILEDADPSTERERNNLRRLLQTHPGKPQAALLEHLHETLRRRNTPAAAPPKRVDATVHFESTEAGRSVEIPVNSEARTRIQTTLRDKLLLTAFQPVNALPGGNVIGVEALTRFISDDGAGAHEWFTEATAAGLGTELEIAALHCALAAAQDIPEHLYVALNLTPAALRDPRAQALLAANLLTPVRTIVELTGNLEIADMPLLNVLTPLRALGMRLAVSAVGAAMLPMDRIEELHPDIIKLDRHLIEGIDSNDGQRNRARNLIRLARSLEASVIAEGIEAESQLIEVTALGVDAVQGYLLGRPTVDPHNWSAWSLQPEPEAQPTP